MQFGAVVTYRNSFVVVVGRNSERVFKYDAEHDVWEKLPVSLSKATYGVTAVLITSEMIPACNITKHSFLRYTSSVSVTRDMFFLWEFHQLRQTP